MLSGLRELCGGNEHVTQIAYVLGYEHASQFTRDFKKTFGVTPRRLRRKVGLVQLVVECMEPATQMQACHDGLKR